MWKESILNFLFYNKIKLNKINRSVYPEHFTGPGNKRHLFEDRMNRVSNVSTPFLKNNLEKTREKKKVVV